MERMAFSSIRVRCAFREMLRNLTRTSWSAPEGSEAKRLPSSTMVVALVSLRSGRHGVLRSAL